MTARAEMKHRKIIINETGTYVVQEASNPALPRHQRARLIKISDKKLPINSQGGYLSPKLQAQCQKQSIMIHPSALIGEIEITGPVRGLTIGPDCAVGSGTVFQATRPEFVITIEAGVVLGQQNLLKNNLKIKTAVILGTANKISGNIVDDFQDPEYGLYTIGAETVIGDRNTFSENFAVEPQALIGNGNLIETELELSRRTRLGDNNWLGQFVKLGPGVTLGSDCAIYPDAQIESESVLGNSVIVQEKSWLKSGVTVGSQAKIGAECRLSEQSKVSSGAIIGPKSMLATGVFIGPRIAVPAGTQVYPGKIQDYLNNIRQERQ